MGEIVARLTGVSKHYPGVTALNKVAFELCRGEVHVLLGENGAGKSTLIGVLGGIVQPDVGEIIIKGDRYSSLNPQLSQQLGIGVVHQELSLVPQLSVAENIFLGRLPMTRGRVNWKRLNQEAKDWLTRFGLDIDPAQPVREFSVAIQQAVEITKILSLQADIIVMDEPTSSLSSKEVERLFQLVNDLKNRGCSIVYISHRMDELKRIGDRVTVLKDGEVVGTRNLAEVQVDELIHMMVGRRITRLKKSSQEQLGEEILRVEELSSPGKIHSVSFSVRSGEVLGIGGIVGSGRTELVKAIFGADPERKGRILLHGKPVRIAHPQDALMNGICLIPEDRRTEGLILGFPVRTNLTVPYWQKIRTLLVNKKRETVLAEEYQAKLRIKTPSCESKVATLSGGNQQKVVIGKWCAVDSQIVIFDEPTRGIDVGSKQEIQELIVELAKEGKAVILISSELPELLAVSDRVLVMYNGKIVSEFQGCSATEEDIVYCATTGSIRGGTSIE